MTVIAPVIDTFQLSVLFQAWPYMSIQQVHEGHLDENVFLALDEMAIGH